MLTEIIELDKIEIVGEFKHIQYRIASIIVKDGQEIARTFTRKVISPGEDYSNAPEDVKQICALVHTPEVINRYLAANE